MFKQVVYLAKSLYVSTRDQQLIISSRGSVIEDEVSNPIEDIGLVILDSPQVVLTTGALQRLLSSGVVVLVCDDSHNPAGMLLPLVGHSLQQKRQQAQIDCPKPVHKQLWAQTVRAKIKNQATLLGVLGIAEATLHRLADGVKSGDVENAEARAAQYYWSKLFGQRPFSRHPAGDFPNNMLNFGYQVLRATVARGIIAAGLLPGLGIFHHNQYSAFALVDDIMEPYRPMVDALVVGWLKRDPTPQAKLTVAMKRHLLTLPSLVVRMDSQQTAIFTAVNRTCASLAQCYLKERKTINYPTLCDLTLIELCGF